MNDQAVSNITLLKFPCNLPMQALGKADLPEIFKKVVILILYKHFPNLSEGGLRIGHITAKHFIALQLKYMLINKAQLDALYQELSLQLLILMTL